MPDPAPSVRLDRLGTPALQAGALSAVYLAGVGEGSRARIEAGGVERILRDRDELADADVVVVSTRLGRGELAAVLRDVRERAGCPVVALAHTGGEALAVEIVRGGAVAVVAEGNEASLAALLSAQVHDETLVETYDRQTSRGAGGTDRAGSLDEVTGLAPEAAFAARLAECAQTGDVPRIAYLRVLNLDDAVARLSPGAVGLLRRRLTTQFREVAQRAGADLFVLGLADLALLAEELSPHGVEALGRSLAAITETFAPSGNRNLALAIGHAGPEVTAELATLRELAHRALLVAAGEHRSSTVGADALALGVAGTTELEAAMRLVSFVEQHTGQPPGHGLRVAELTALLADELGYDAAQRSRVRLAARLHEIGKAGLPVEAMTEQRTLTGDLLWAYRSHPVRGAEYVRTSAGDDVAEVVRSQHERWDGTGFPDGLMGDRIPLGARILAVADRFEALRHGALGLGETLTAMQEDASTVLDPSLVAMALPLFASSATTPLETAA